MGSHTLFCMVLGTEPRALAMLGEHCTTEPFPVHSLLLFALFETGSCHGVQVGFELCIPPSFFPVLGCATTPIWFAVLNEALWYM